MNFWKELRRRRVFRLAGLYIVGAWLVIQVADISFPAWGVPETALRYLFIAAAACFPVALIFSWFYDITARGIVRTEPIGDTEVIDLRLKRSDYILLVALLAIGVAILLGSLGKIQEQIGTGAPATAGIERRDNSIAVLPFTNLDVNADTGYFSDGITEEILHRLSTLGALHVLASTSSFAFRNSDEGPASVSEKLGVRYLLQGSVRRDKDYVRVTARLLDETGFQVWSESFDRKLQSIFVIQTEIAQAVSREIVKEIIPARDLPAGRTTENMEAYDEYLAGKVYLDSRTADWRHKAIVAFERAIELDVGFAPSYAGLATAMTVNQSWGENWEEARTLAQKAVELDPELADAHAILGLIQAAGGDNNRGLESLRRAVDLDPSLAIAYGWMSFTLSRLGLDAEAEATMLRGLEVDPLNPILIKNISNKESRTGSFDRAERLLLRLTNLPEPPGPTFYWLHELYTQWGRFSQAVDAAKHHIRLHASGGDPWIFEALAFAYAGLGFSAEADYWYGKFRGQIPEEQPIHSTYFFFKLSEDQSRIAEELKNLESGPAFENGDRAYFLGYGGLAHIQVGAYEKGIERLEQGLNLYQKRYQPEDPPTGIDLALLNEHWDTGILIDIAHQLAFAYRQIGRTEDAQELLQSLQLLYWSRDDAETHNPGAYENLALQRGLLGDTAGALEALQQSVELGWANYYEVLNDPAWAGIVEGPGFRELLDQVAAEIQRQRAIVEAADAEHDFRAEVERLLATPSEP